MRVSCPLTYSTTPEGWQVSPSASACGKMDGAAESFYCELAVAVRPGGGGGGVCLSGGKTRRDRVIGVAQDQRDSPAQRASKPHVCNIL